MEKEKLSDYEPHIMKMEYSEENRACYLIGGEIAAASGCLKTF